MERWPSYNAAMHYSLRTLLILSLLGPPVLAEAWAMHAAWRAERERKSRRIHWMISPTAAPEDYARIPQTVGELEALGTPTYLGIGGVRSSTTKR